MRKLITKINVLGTEYKVYASNPKTDKELEENDGFCDYSKRIIVIDETSKASEERKQHVLTHEIVHAFLNESGLRGQGHAEWAYDEEIVDWIAAQIPKMQVVRKSMLKEYIKTKKKAEK